ncbi:hypothetical protein ACWWJF_03200 [Symbiopectobacterium sp. Eva_TO]
MANFVFSGISNNYSRLNDVTVNQSASNNKILALANKITNIGNTAIEFVKKNPRTTATCIGFASMLVGVTTANPGLIYVGVSSLVAAALYSPPSLTSLPSHNDLDPPSPDSFCILS